MQPLKRGISVNKSNKERWRFYQQGAAMVEMAIIIGLFLAMVFAIIEFSIVLLKWGRAAESTRAGVRFAIVNTPVCELSGPGAVCLLDCEGGGAKTVTRQCTTPGVDCTELLAEMKRKLPDIEAENINVTYACSNAGNPENPTNIPVVTVELTNLQHSLIVPTILGFSAGTAWTIPDFAATKIGEDLETVMGP